MFRFFLGIFPTLTCVCFKRWRLSLIFFWNKVKRILSNQVNGKLKATSPHHSHRSASPADMNSLLLLKSVGVLMIENGWLRWYRPSVWLNQPSVMMRESFTHFYRMCCHLVTNLNTDNKPLFIELTVAAVVLTLCDRWWDYKVGYAVWFHPAVCPSWCQSPQTCPSGTLMVLGKSTVISFPTKCARSTCTNCGKSM